MTAKHTGTDENGRKLWNSVYIPWPDDSSELVKEWWIYVFQFEPDQHQEVAEDLEAYKPDPEKPWRRDDIGKALVKHFRELFRRRRVRDGCPEPKCSCQELYPYNDGSGYCGRCYLPISERKAKRLQVDDRSSWDDVIEGCLGDNPWWYQSPH